MFSYVRRAVKSGCTGRQSLLRLLETPKVPWDSQVKYDSRRRIKCHCRGWGSLSRLPCPLKKNIQKIFAMNTRPFTLAEFGQLVSASLEAESQGRRNPETPANVLSFCTPRPRRAGMPDKVNLFNLC